MLPQLALLAGGIAWICLAHSQSPAETGSAARKANIANPENCSLTADDYPAASRRLEATCTTKIRLLIAADGSLESAEVLQSAGPTRAHKLLNRSAVNLLRRCRYVNATDAQDQPVSSSVDMYYLWSINGAHVRSEHPFFSDLSVCAPSREVVADQYPKAKLPGTVKLAFQIGPDGQAQDGRIAQPSGTTAANSNLDRLALIHLMGCRFADALAGQDVFVNYQWPVELDFHGVERWDVERANVRRLSAEKAANNRVAKE